MRPLISVISILAMAALAGCSHDKDDVQSGPQPYNEVACKDSTSGSLQFKHMCGDLIDPLASIIRSEVAHERVKMCQKFLSKLERTYGKKSCPGVTDQFIAETRIALALAFEASRPLPPVVTEPPPKSEPTVPVVKDLCPIMPKDDRVIFVDSKCNYGIIQPSTKLKVEIGTRNFLGMGDHVICKVATRIMPDEPMYRMTLKISEDENISHDEWNKLNAHYFELGARLAIDYGGIITTKFRDGFVPNKNDELVFYGGATSTGFSGLQNIRIHLSTQSFCNFTGGEVRDLTIEDIRKLIEIFAEVNVRNLYPTPTVTQVF